MTPAEKPSTPKMRGNGASARKRVTTASTVPAPAHATPQVTPIPIAPRTRRTHFCMIASDPVWRGLRPRLLFGGPQVTLDVSPPNGKLTPSPIGLDHTHHGRRD